MFLTPQTTNYSNHDQIRDEDVMNTSSKTASRNDASLARLRGLARLLSAVALLLVVAPSASAQANADARATEIAESVMEKMGGASAWEQTRYVRWHFFGRRTHYWDKWTGNVRIESENGVVLMNIHSMQGRAWNDGMEVTDPDALSEQLEGGYRAWINDSYWMFMPYKLLDPGVTLRYMGDGELMDGDDAQVLEMTFDGVGVTPQNRYLVRVSETTGLVEEWSYFRSADDEEPGFTLPWAGWQQFGSIMLSTSRGRGFEWDIAVFDELSASVFSSPDPVH